MLKKILIGLIVTLFGCEFIQDKVTDFYIEKIHKLESRFEGKNYILINEKNDSLYLDFKESDVFVDFKDKFDKVSWDVKLKEIGKFDFVLRIGFDHFEIINESNDKFDLRLANEKYQLIKYENNFEINNLEGVWVEEIYLGYLDPSVDSIKSPPPPPPCIDGKTNIPSYEFLNQSCFIRYYCDSIDVPFSINRSLGIIRFHKKRNGNYLMLRENLWKVNDTNNNKLLINFNHKKYGTLEKRLVKIISDKHLTTLRTRQTK